MATERFTVSIDEEVADQLEEAAEEENRSRSNYIEHTLEQSFEQRETGPLTATFEMAENEFWLQVRILATSLITFAVMIWAYSSLPGGVLWLLPAAFFGLIVVSTTVGALAGLWNAIDPSADTAAADSDEVEA